MKKIPVISFAFLLLSFLTSCINNCEEGSGPIVRKSLELKSFSEIVLKNNVEVFLSQGDVQLVEVKGQENIIALLNTEVGGDSWEIELDKCISTKEALEVHITVPNLDYIELNGSGSIRSRNNFKSELLSVFLNGSGDMDLDLQVKELETELNGSGDLQLKGATKQHDIILDGSGDINAEELNSDVVNIKVNGSGDVRVNVSYEINVDVNGSGDVYYKGQVKKISSDIDGSGNLHQLSN